MDKLAGQVAMLREALAGALNVVEGEYGPCDPLAIECQQALTATSSDWLKQHDAEVLRNAAKIFDAEDEFSGYSDLIRMAAELEGEKKC